MIKLISDPDNKFYNYDDRWERVRFLEHLMGMNVRLLTKLFDIEVEKI